MPPPTRTSSTGGIPVFSIPIRGASCGSSREFVEGSTRSPRSGRPSRCSARPEPIRTTTTTARPGRPSRLLVEAGYAVITGGGPGIMEAANRGARDAGGVSIGANIELPREQHPNDYQDISLGVPVLLRAKDDVREVLARAFVVFPGGFGTHGRAVRGAHPDPDRQGAPLPRRALRQRLLERPARLDALRDARRGQRVAGAISSCRWSPTAPEEAVAMVVACNTGTCDHPAHQRSPPVTASGPSHTRSCSPGGALFAAGEPRRCPTSPAGGSPAASSWCSRPGGSRRTPGRGRAPTGGAGAVRVGRPRVGARPAARDAPGSTSITGRFSIMAKTDPLLEPLHTRCAACARCCSGRCPCADPRCRRAADPLERGDRDRAQDHRPALPEAPRPATAAYCRSIARSIRRGSSARALAPARRRLSRASMNWTGTRWTEQSSERSRSACEHCRASARGRRPGAHVRLRPASSGALRATCR